MSGHSKWHSIKHKKAAVDARRGKIFTRHAKLIAIAARDGGGDPDMNSGLRTAISNAKAENMPSSNIQKAIKKGIGGDKEGLDLKELMYEGFGPAGTAFYVQVLTDNSNRSVASVKTIFAKNGGQMGASGSVGYMFDKKGLIIAKVGDKDADEAQLEVIDAGAEDLSIDGDVFEITTAPNDLMKVKDSLEGLGFEIAKAELGFLAKDTVKVDDSSEAKRILKLAEALEDDEDVANIFSNFDISEEIMEEVL